MKKFIVGLVCFYLGFLFSFLMIPNSIKVTKIESDLQEIKSALVTIEINGEEIKYYMGE